MWHCLEDLASEAVPERPAAAGDGLEARMEMAQVGDYTDMRMTVARARAAGWVDGAASGGVEAGLEEGFSALYAVWTNAAEG